MAEENKETDCKGCLRYAKALIQLRYGIIPKKQCIRMTSSDTLKCAVSRGRLD